jgi:uncharacterized protein YhfF
MAEESIEAFWRRFVAATGLDEAYAAWSFGDTPHMATELAQLVRDGRKRATAGLRPSADGEETARPGDLSVILDGDKRPICVIRTTAVDVRRFGDVDAEFAAAEGEGDGTLDHWRTEHRRFFATQGVTVDDDTEIVLERFELLWP